MAVKAVIDTNIWVSALLNPSGYPAKLLKAFIAGRFELVVSEPLLVELADVLNRPRIKIKYGLDEADISEFLQLLEEQSEHVFPPGTIAICRDPDDNAVIETAIVGKAFCIVSRDDDLKFDVAVAEYLSSLDITVLTIDRFLKLLENAG